MYIAQKLRKQNITGYLLYMFQVEDTLRAYGLDLERIKQEYLVRFDYTTDQQAEVTQWYANLIQMMREEGVTQSGHLQILRNTIILLTDRHAELLNDPKQPFYNTTYYKALPAIVELRAHGTNKDKSEIENCLDALYGITLLKMQGKEVSEGTLLAIRPIIHLLEMLSQLYTQES